MSEIKSFSLLISLTPVEKRKALASLKARNSNPKKQDPQLVFFEVCCKELKRTDELDAETIKLHIWRKIFPGQDYQDTRFRKMAFRLNKYLQEFLMGEYLIREKGYEGLRNVLLYRMLWERRQGKALESLSKKLEGEPTELYAVNRFMEYKKLLEGGANDPTVLQQGLETLDMMEAHEQVFRQLKRACMEWVAGSPVKQNRWEKLLPAGLELPGMGNVYARLLEVLVALETQGRIQGIQKLNEFIKQFNLLEEKPLQEIYLVFLMLRRFLVGKLEEEDQGAAVFLRPLLYWEKGFREMHVDFYRTMEVPEFLHLFDRGVGYLGLEEVEGMLEEFLVLVPEGLAEKMALTIRCLYLFQGDEYESVLEISDWDETGISTYDPTEKDEQHLAIRLGMVQFQSKIALKSSTPSIELQKRWVSRCIRKCPTMKNGTKSMLRDMIEFSMMLNKKFPKGVMLDHLKKVKEMEDVSGLGIHKKWLYKRFVARCSA